MSSKNLSKNSTKTNAVAKKAPARQPPPPPVRMAAREISWVDADHFYLCGHPVPGSFGIRAIDAIVTMAENGSPHRGATYIAYNPTHTMLIIYYVRRDGRCGITKEYVSNKGRCFDIAGIIEAKRQRLHGVALERLEALLTSLLEPEAGT